MTNSTISALVAVNRFGLGPRPGEIGPIGTDPRAYVLDQCGRPAEALLDDPTLVPSDEGMRSFRLAEIEREGLRARRTSAAAKPAAPQAPGSSGAAPGPAPEPVAVQEPPVVEQRIFRAELTARFRRQATTTTPFLERLVLFWSNHFAVSASKGGSVRSLVGAMEREAIRPRVLGRFAEMLRAVETHPAMLIFLDNNQSIGPTSLAGRNQKRGLNENLAREILELHTLGVDGGYGQDDVTSLARIITGWTMSNPDDDLFQGGKFTFAPQRHEPGDHRVLGKLYPAGDHRQGLATLDDLARHPSTARHVATKLARHFVADEPPPALVETLARTFVATDGDLGAVTRALVEAPEAWAAPPTKVRSPQEFLIACLRAVDRVPDIGVSQQALKLMGQPVFDPPGPNGWSDRTAEWLSPAGLSTRLDVAMQIAKIGADRDPRTMIDDLFGRFASGETRQALMRAESRQQAVALLFMAPQFQRR